MKISDLNHIATISEESNVAGGYGYYGRTFYENDYINFDVYGDTFIFTHIDGNTAQIDGGAVAYGSDTYTKVAGSTFTVEGHTSQSSLFAISVSD
ncbi:hypothetical protein [Lyngbya sp. CCY1209]|uniref:hypothetical protein n=1 Tax=Lyngbya sp. CCY1209 TaxID=2886103 RepID=UPI002D1FC8FA|nr:hypothetical protein [Lyngbya sp. CCY1209]MEB3884979.1 hypothetical protein [Lyngbya sp. CCY1209]